MRFLYNLIILCIMGCTTSATSVVTPDVTAAKEQSVKFESPIDEKDMENYDKITMEDPNEIKDLIKVLPKCDTLAESLHLISNNKSLSDLRSLDNVRVIQEMENATEISNDKNGIDPTQDHKISNLKEIVEKVIETNITDYNKLECQNSKNDDQENHNIKESSVILELNDAPVNDSVDDMQKDEHCEEVASPAQSITSRVTRWEALADIAAELPPSLAVDPITGQIFLLPK